MRFLSAWAGLGDIVYFNYRRKKVLQVAMFSVVTFILFLISVTLGTMLSVRNSGMSVFSHFFFSLSIGLAALWGISNIISVSAIDGANSISAKRVFRVVLENLATINPTPGVAGSYGSISLSGNILLVRPAGGSEHKFKINLVSPKIGVDGSISTSGKDWCFREHMDAGGLPIGNHYAYVYNQNGFVSTSDGGPAGCVFGVAYDRNGRAIK